MNGSSDAMREKQAYRRVAEDAEKNAFLKEIAVAEVETCQIDDVPEFDVFALSHLFDSD